MSARGGGAEKLAMKDDRRRRRKPRGVLLPDTNPRRFVVARRPRLSKLTDYPELDFADYERRLASLQGVLQLIQQAYLGSSERPPARAVSFAASAGRSILAASRSIRFQRPISMSMPNITCRDSGAICRRMVR